MSVEIALDPAVNRTGDVWHVMVPGLVPGLLYGESWEGEGTCRVGGKCYPWRAMGRLLTCTVTLPLQRLPGGASPSYQAWICAMVLLLPLRAYLPSPGSYLHTPTSA